MQTLCAFLIHHLVWLDTDHQAQYNITFSLVCFTRMLF